MSPQETVRRLQEMHTEVLRTMPHVGCGVESSLVEGMILSCTCYKRNLLADIRCAEQVLRAALGMEPF